MPTEQDTAVIGLSGNYEVLINSGHARASRIELGSSTYTGVQWLTVGFPACSLTVDGNITIHPGLGMLNITLGGRAFMTGTGVTLTDSGKLALVLGATLTLGFHDTLRIVGEGSAEVDGESAIVGDSGFVWNSNQLFHTDAGTSTIATNYKDDGGISVLAVVVEGGGLIFAPPDSAVFNSMVRVDSGAALRCSKCRFNTMSVITGEGTLSFEGGAQEVAGVFLLSGNIHVVSGVVNFDPNSPDTVVIDTFTIDSGATFTSSVTINAAVANMNGGTTNANITSNQYNWTAGNCVGSSGTDIIVNPGTTLNIVGPVEKVLDTRNLVISGTADMSGSGVFSLLNGASITVSALGTLTIGDSITITGTGDSLINHGQLTFDCPNDTATVGTFLYNKPISRPTPGTIDILDGTVVWESIQNEGIVNIHAGATLVVTGSFANLGSGFLCGAGTLDMMGGTLFNNGFVAPGSSPGILTINGNLNNLDVIVIELGGTNPGTQYDRLQVSGALTLTLGGALNLSRIGEFVPSLTDTFHILSFGDRNGVFSEVNGTAVGNGTFMEIAYRPTEIILYVCGGVPDDRVNDLTIRLNLATSSVILSWSAVCGANSYKVYRSEPGSYDPTVLLASTADTTYTHTGTLGGGGATRLVYHVVASTEEP